jgi:hypothetical protein
MLSKVAITLVIHVKIVARQVEIPTAFPLQIAHRLKSINKRHPLFTRDRGYGGDYLLVIGILHQRLAVLRIDEHDINLLLLEPGECFAQASCKIIEGDVPQRVIGADLPNLGILTYQPEIRLIAVTLVFLVLAAWEIYSPRRLQQLPRRMRWPSNIGVMILNTVLVRLIAPTTVVAVALICEAQG